MLAAIICAALYPNIVKVLTPAKTFAPSSAGYIPRQIRADEISFKTKQDGYVSVLLFSMNVRTFFKQFSFYKFIFILFDRFIFILHLLTTVLLTIQVLT